MIVATAILGHVCDPAFAARDVEWLPLTHDEAAKRRQRRSTVAGTDVAIDMPRGTYLVEGAVLLDDGSRIVAVARAPEATLLVRLRVDGDPEGLVEQAVSLGHALGNAHVPVEVDGALVRCPITTSPELARQLVEALRLDGVEVEIARVPLGRSRPLRRGHAHA